MSKELTEKNEVVDSIKEAVADFNVQYRDDIVSVFGEEVVRKLESLHYGHCYVPHYDNGKAVITGPFKSLIRGVLIGVMIEKKRFGLE